MGVFRTDMRVFNPSATKDIQIQAYYLPVGNADNTAVQPVSFTVPKRQMVSYDDVVGSLFHSGNIGAIRLKSDDDFVATQRIFATQVSSQSCAISGTLGQFVPGLDVSTAMKQAVLIQLKSGGNFRTNIGAVNPNPVPANVTWRLYDKSNNLVATGTPVVMPPMAVIAPTNVASQFFFNPGSADLSDAWVSFVSDQPIFAYASVVDNGTTDPTFIPMAADSGAPPIGPTAKVYNVSERDFTITITPRIVSTDLSVGDHVTFHITVADSNHGFELVDPNGNVLLDPQTYSPGATIDRTFTVTAEGTYNYFCANPSCGFGHDSMVGSFDVGSSSNPGGPYY
ncbi:MAG TPA: hypothetical protein VKH35_15130 [Thermoanaerobaculia bacterium]|nr:hypothetical protein [Thermoanaerobaculia bacterium]